MAFMFNAGFIGPMIPILCCWQVKMLFKNGTESNDNGITGKFFFNELETLKSKRFACTRVLLAIIMAGSFYPVVSDAQTSAEPVTKEYFVQQDANEDLLIKINTFEAEFESKLTAQGGEVLLLSGIPGNRIAPVFQYVHASSNSRQLEIEVRLKLHTARSQFGIE